MTQKTFKRYSESFKQQVVREYEAGGKINDLRKKYGIGGVVTIQEWVKKYSYSGLRHKVIHIQQADEAKRVKELEARVRELEQALGKVTLEKLVLESTLKVLEAEYGIEAQKNAPASSSRPITKGENQTGSN